MYNNFKISIFLKTLKNLKKNKKPLKTLFTKNNKKPWKGFLNAMA